MISASSKSNFDMAKSLKKTVEYSKRVDYDNYGRMGVDALKQVTPQDSGNTANSWGYKITKKKGVVTIDFFNTNIQNGAPIAILLQYGHATGGGGYVVGRDYINPAIQPIFDELAEAAWKEVRK